MPEPQCTIEDAEGAETGQIEEVLLQLVGMIVVVRGWVTVGAVTMNFGRGH